MKPEIIIMLTHHDKTHPECEDIFEACKDLPVQHWGFKNVDQSMGVMKSCAAAMKAAGKTTYLEVVTYDEESCLAGAQTAIDCGFDCLCGTIYYESVHKKLEEAGITYMPFVGKVHGSPSVLEGTNEEIIAEAKALKEKGIKGFDILAYRHVVDGEALAKDFCAALNPAETKICIAGSISSYERIDKMYEVGAWGFTMGTALFDKKFVDGSFKANLQAVCDYMASK